MKLNSKTNFGAICVVLTLASTQATALTLGRLRGGALLGKELDVSVQVQFAPEDDVSSACFRAEVAYGDAPLERSRITVQSQPGTQPNSQIVRITSAARVDEAVVTVDLLATCAPKASRRYVVLADVLSEIAASAPVPAAAPSTAIVAIPSKDLATPTAPVAALRSDGEKARIKRTAAPAKSAGSNAAPKAAASKDASERDAVTKALHQANAAALEELQRRVDDISKWQATSQTAEELIKSESREKALEAELKGLRQLTARNQQNIQTVTAALEKAESENYGSGLVYGLGALLLACLGFLAFVLTRLRRGGPDALPWWSSGEAMVSAPVPLTDKPAAKVLAPSEPLAKVQPSAARVVPAAPAPAAAVAPVVAAPVPAAPVPVAPVVPEVLPPASVAKATVIEAPTTTTLPDVDISAFDEIDATAPTAPLPAVASSTQVGAGQSVQYGHASLRAINTKEMLDVRQQAEFFMALGQHDDAVSLLENSIRSSNEANPLVYLDLLKIFHTLSRRLEFEHYRTEFNQQFTGRLPEYANFLMEGNGLEAYDDICQQIVVLWPTDYTVDFIEQCLVRTPEDDPEQGIDLEAFKDLLLLYGVLKRLDQANDSSVVSFSASRIAHASAPPAAVAAGAASLDADQVTPLPPIGAGDAAAAPSADLDVSLDLDIDLDIDVGGEPPPQAKEESDNLINFDLSGYEPPKPSE